MNGLKTHKLFIKHKYYLPQIKWYYLNNEALFRSGSILGYIKWTLSIDSRENIDYVIETN